MLTGAVTANSGDNKTETEQVLGRLINAQRYAVKWESDLAIIPHSEDRS